MPVQEMTKARISAAEREARLPDKPSALLELALDCMAAVDRDAFYPDGEIYFAGKGADGFGRLDLAGAVMAKALGNIIDPPFMAANVITANKLNALGRLVCGDIVGAVVFIDSEECYDAMVVPCKEEREALYASLTWSRIKIVDKWDAVDKRSLMYRDWEEYSRAEISLRELVLDLRSVDW